MSKNVSYFKIGLFFVSAMTLTVASVLYFGFLAGADDVLECETFFDHSVQGLSKGAAVNFRGFRVGQVSDIGLAPSSGPGGHQAIKVDFFLRPSLLSGTPGTSPEEAMIYLENETPKGLRCYLTYQGVSGLAFLDLDYLSDDVFEDAPTFAASERFAIPSAQGSVMEISQSLSRIVRSFRSVDFSALNRSLQSALASFERLSTSLSAQSEARGEDLSKTLATVERASAGVAALAEDLTRGVSGLDLRSRSELLGATLNQIRSSMRLLDGVLRGPRDNLPETLENLRVMSVNLRELSVLAKRYPSHMLFGLPPTEVKPR
jgi:ABC-type transporter Mla subunit MlaD